MRLAVTKATVLGLVPHSSHFRGRAFASAPLSLISLARVMSDTSSSAAVSAAAAARSAEEAGAAAADAVVVAIPASTASPQSPRPTLHVNTSADDVPAISTPKSSDSSTVVAAAAAAAAGVGASGLSAAGSAAAGGGSTPGYTASPRAAGPPVALIPSTPMSVFEAARKSPEFIRSQPEQLQGYYEAQNRVIDRLLLTRTDVGERQQAKNMKRLKQELEYILTGDEDDKPEDGEQDSVASSKDTCGVQLAITLSFYANVLLFIIKIFAAVWSGSLAVVSSAVDSALDLLSGSIIYFSTRAATIYSIAKYPIGRGRLEPLSVVVFSSVMGMTSLVLIKEGVQIITDGYTSSHPEIKVDGVSWGVISSVVGVKFLLFLFCVGFRNRSPSAAALAQDHINDTITNALTLVAVGVTTANPDAWVVDPVFAILFAFYILYVWVRTGKEQINRISGRSAAPEAVNFFTIVAYNHDPRILQVDTVRIYYSGTRFLAEVDIVLPHDMELREAHDIGEALQKKIEEFPQVERAFVHLDWESEHDPGSEHVIKGPTGDD